MNIATDHDVYRHLLKEKFQNPQIIFPKTVPRVLTSHYDSGVLGFYQGQLSGLKESTLKNYFSLNILTADLGCPSELLLQGELLSEHELCDMSVFEKMDSADQDEIHDWVVDFKKRYDRDPGLIQFSRVAYSTEVDQALVAYSELYDPNGNNHFLLLFEKSKSGWRYSAEKALFQNWK